MSAIDNDDGQSKRPHKAPKKRKTVASLSGRQRYREKKRPRKLAIQSSDPPSMSSEESVESISVGRMSLETLLAAVNVDIGGQDHHNMGEADGKRQALSSVNRTEIRKQSIKPSHLQSDEDFLSRTSNDREAGSSMSSEDHNSEDGGSTEHVGSSDDDSLQSSQQGQAALGTLLSLVSKGNDAG